MKLSSTVKKNCSQRVPSAVVHNLYFYFSLVIGVNRKWPGTARFTHISFNNAMEQNLKIRSEKEYARYFVCYR